MFVKITNGQVAKYPYSVGDLRRDNPNTSFPKNVHSELMAVYGMYEVQVQPAPDHDPMTQKVVQGSSPENIDGKWVITRSVVDLTPEEAAAIKDRLTAEAELKRARAYREESDPIFFRWQRGSATQEEWLDAVAAIKARYPDPA